MKHKIKNIIAGIKNLWKWRKTIYKDRDWDQWFIYEILKTKLKFQAEYMAKHGITLTAHEKAKEMLECVDMIDKVQNEYYIDLAIAGLVDKNWTDEQFNDVAKKQDEIREELFNKVKENISQWWD